MYVLRDVLDLYDLDYPDIQTMCSYTLSKRELPGLISYGLESVCYHLDVPLLDHHRAGHDAKACAEICLKIFRKNGITDFQKLTDIYCIILGNMCNKSKNYTGPKIKTDHSKSPELKAKTIHVDISKYDPDNLFYEKTVVFTGSLTSMSRREAMQMIANIGGTPENGITLKTNFLVVGQQDFGIVGKGGLSGKQKKAMEYLKKGCKIEIISEKDFLQNI
jgi:DNA polymerase-3 subunit epsilon